MVPRRKTEIRIATKKHKGTKEDRRERQVRRQKAEERR
jgi:hypothetical protein